MARDGAPVIDDLLAEMHARQADLDAVTRETTMRLDMLLRRLGRDGRNGGAVRTRRVPADPAGSPPRSRPA